MKKTAIAGTTKTTIKFQHCNPVLNYIICLFPFTVPWTTGTKSSYCPVILLALCYDKRMSSSNAKGEI
jgi:hypothetical protein